jgi:hypothetical protein
MFTDFIEKSVILWVQHVLPATVGSGVLPATEAFSCVVWTALRFCHRDLYERLLIYQTHSDLLGHDVVCVI